MRPRKTTAAVLACAAVAAGAAALTACAPEAQLSPLERAKGVNQSKHVAQLFADQPEVVDDVLGIKTTKLFFPTSETLIPVSYTHLTLPTKRIV